MLKAAIAHSGTVMLDVISPCVTFNDHEGSTKSYKYIKDHEEPLQDIGFVPSFEDIDVDYDPGTTVDVSMHDGSQLRLRKLEERLRPHRQDRRDHAAGRGARKRRDADRRVLRQHHRAKLHRAAQPDRAVIGQNDRRADASFAPGAGRDHGRAEINIRLDEFRSRKAKSGLRLKTRSPGNSL